MADASSDRSAPRLRTLLLARAEFNGGATTVECTVRDLSETGARIQVPSSAVLPPRFTLFVPKHGRRYDAVMRDLSKTGAKVEGLIGVPVGTPLVLDLGNGQLALGAVNRSQDAEIAVEFETPLVSDGVTLMFRVSFDALRATIGDANQ